MRVIVGALRAHGGGADMRSGSAAAEPGSRVITATATTSPDGGPSTSMAIVAMGLIDTVVGGRRTRGGPLGKR
jgi:hypothetical protein